MSLPGDASQWITLAFLVAAMVVFVLEWLPIELVGVLLMVGLILTGVLSPEDGVAGFSNPAVLTVASLFVISQGVVRTGAVAFLAQRLIHLGRGDERRLVFFSTILVAVCSAFISNTPIVAIFVPLIIGVARQAGISPSRLLIPISFASILGGTLTMLGTSTNLLVAQVVQQKGDPALPTLQIFDFLPVGIVLMAIGLTYLCLWGYRRLPDRLGVATGAATSEYMTEIEVTEASPLRDQDTAKRILADQRLRVVQIIRGDRILWPPFEGQKLVVGDILLLKGPPQVLFSLLQERNVELTPELRELEDVSLRAGEATLAEVVLTPGSRYIGRTIAGIRFRRHHQVSVVGLQRRGSHHRGEISNISLRLGDVLLVHGSVKAIDLLRGEEDFLLVEGVEQEVVYRRKAPIALGIVVAVLAGAYVDVQWLMPMALLGVCVLVLTRCLTVRQAFRSIDWSILVLIAGMLSLGLAMDRTGAASALASALTNGLTGVGLPASWMPYVVLSGLYVMTVVMTEFVSNNATAVVMTHLAFTVASDLGVSPKPLVFAVAYGASMSFCTPIGYQTNTFVLGPGNYRFGDFFRIGFPLSVACWLVCTFLIPVVYPF